MFKITKKIKITNSSIFKNIIFRNEEINQSLIHNFKCCNCNNKNEFVIIPYKTGFSFLEIYDNEKVLFNDEIINNNIASKTSPYFSYLGNFTINNLPTLYFAILCDNCKSNFMIVFSYGEKQPGLTILEISGIWNFIYL